jgi:DNA-binding response OmpR family regulator
VDAPRRKRCLLVEDDDWTRYALASLVRHKGWEVDTAATVEEGIEQLKTDPDCVLLDLGLPDGSGEAVLRQIREQGRPCRVVVCSATTDEDRLDGLKSLQPDAVFTKPVEVDEVLAVCGQ